MSEMRKNDKIKVNDWGIEFWKNLSVKYRKNFEMVRAESKQ